MTRVWPAWRAQATLVPAAVREGRLRAAALAGEGGRGSALVWAAESAGGLVLLPEARGVQGQDRRHSGSRDAARVQRTWMTTARTAAHSSLLYGAHSMVCLPGFARSHTTFSALG